MEFVGYWWCYVEKLDKFFFVVFYDFFNNVWKFGFSSVGKFIVGNFFVYK